MKKQLQLLEKEKHILNLMSTIYLYFSWFGLTFLDNIDFYIL